MSYSRASRRRQVDLGDMNFGVDASFDASATVAPGVVSHSVSVAEGTPGYSPPIPDTIYQAQNLYSNQAVDAWMNSWSDSTPAAYQMSAMGKKSSGGSVSRAPTSEKMTLPGGKQVPNWMVYAGGAAAIGALYWFFLRK